MKFDHAILSDFNASHDLEWIETNGIGGYASGTVSGAHSKRYHGLLIAATNPPVGRMNVLSKLDETIIAGDERYELGTNQYPGAIHPQGFRHLKKFERGYFPKFYYKAGDIEIKKTIAAIHGSNTTVILYDVLETPASFEFQLLPLYASRDFHGLSHANDFIGQHFLFQDGLFRTLNYHGCPELFVSVPDATFIVSRGWYYNLEYAVERHRGLDFREDLYSHGRFSIALTKGSRLGIIVSTEDPTGADPFRLVDAELSRRKKVAEKFSWHEHLERLALAADQFIVKRGSLYTIIAGYHWFADWGRDTMISLPGLCLVTERFENAKQIIEQFSKSVSQGMLPNRYPDNGEVPEYNTIDATFWFFIAIYHYYKYTADKGFIKQLMPILKDIIAWHYKGTRFNIKVDPFDELIQGGEPGVQLTWMDAKVGDWVVTPRRGKPVEINALWYNALRIMEYLSSEVEEKNDIESYRGKAKKVLKSFNHLFWNENQHCLYDCIDGEHRDDAVRPNQIYAVSLPFALLKKEKAEQVFKTVTAQVLTPKGLRSLSSSHKDYNSSYAGDIRKRDGAYHQGTVWSFLIGPYVDALIRVKGANGRTDAVSILNDFFEHLDEAGIGTISEIFDAEPPHAPRGCIAQAWGVAEALRVAVEHNLFGDDR